MCFTIRFLFFQAIDYKAWKPVRHIDLGLSRAKGLCVSNNWLVVTTNYINETTVHAYSLPDCKEHASQNLSAPENCFSYRPSDPQYAPRADSTGLVYVPCSTYVAVLEISETGNLTQVQKVTAGGELWQNECYSISLAVGLEPGQLYVASCSPPNVTVVLVNTVNNSIERTLTLPVTVYHGRPLIDVAVLGTGQILVLCAYWENEDLQTVLYMYRSVFEPPQLLAGIPLTSPGNCLGHRNQFLILDAYEFQSSLIEVLSDNGTLLHTVDVLDGRAGVWLHELADVAIWEDCGLVLGLGGVIVLLCPI